MAEKWIQKAHLKEGSFTKQARKAGEGVQEYASDVIAKKHEGKSVNKTTLKRALLAKTFAKMARRRKEK